MTTPIGWWENGGKERRDNVTQLDWTLLIRQCTSTGLDPAPLIGISSSLLGFLPETLHYHKEEDLKQFWGPKALDRSCAISAWNNWFAQSWTGTFSTKGLSSANAGQSWHCVNDPPGVPSLSTTSITSLCTYIFLLNKLLLFLSRSMSCRIIFYLGQKNLDLPAVENN